MVRKNSIAEKQNQIKKTIPKKVLIPLLVIAGIVIISLIVFLVFRTPQRERTERQKENPELLIRDLSRSEAGDRQVGLGDTVVVHYVARIEGEKDIIDSTIEKNRPFIFTVGDGNVPQGFEIGVEGMKVGDKRRITIPAHLAYGSGGVRNLVPPEATVIFELNLLEIR